MARSPRKSKGSKWRKTRKVAGTVNRYRKSQFRKDGGVSNFLFGDYSCPYGCGRVRNCMAKSHKKVHEIRGDRLLRVNTAPPLRVNTVSAASPARRPAIAQPSKEKQAERARRGGQTTTPQAPKETVVAAIMKNARKIFTAWSTSAPEGIEAAQTDLLDLVETVVAFSDAIEAKVKTLEGTDWLRSLDGGTAALAPLRELSEELGHLAPMAGKSYRLLSMAYLADVEQRTQNRKGA